jgi:ribosomal protein L11 methyltransferase
MPSPQLQTTRGKLWKVSVATTAVAEDAVQELLRTVLGGNPVSYTDVKTGRVVVSAFYPNTRPSPADLGRLKSGLQEMRKQGFDMGSGRTKFEAVRPEDWAESWKRHFKPIDVGSTLLIKPSWSSRLPRKSQSVIILDPGLSFGTGQHPTTGFCLERLAAFRNPAAKQSLLDIGTGSGILAIAAAKLGYNPVEAFDFDPTAVTIARRNARRNRVLRQCRVYQADLTSLPVRSTLQYDLICANLVFDLLFAERRRILNRVKPGGSLVLAGILNKEFSELKRIYGGEGFKLVSSRAQGEWRSGMFSGVSS